MKIRTMKLTNRALSLVLALAFMLTIGPVLTLPARAAGEDTYVPLIIESGFTHDIVVEVGASLEDGLIKAADGNGLAATYFDGDNRGANTAFYEKGLTLNGTQGAYGLPSGGLLSFRDPMKSDQEYTYQLASYTGNNVVQVSKPADKASPDAGRFVFVTPGAYSQISILGAAGNGDVIFSATVHYTDESTTSVTFRAPNWATNKYCDTGRIKIKNLGSPDSPAVGRFDDYISALYHFEISTEATKLIKSIEFAYQSDTATEGGIARANLMAVSGCVSSGAPDAPGGVSTSAISDTGFTITWDTVSEVTSYVLDISTEPDFSTLTSYNNSTVSSPATVTGLSAKAPYYYRLRAVNSNGQSLSTPTMEVETAKANAGTATEVSSIAVTTSRSKTTYLSGECFDPTGMVVTATFNNGSKATITNYTLSPDTTTPLALNDTEVTVTYGGKFITVDITVTPPLIITGKDLNDAYTYENGVLTITKNGTYNISMAEGLTSTTDTIVVADNVEATIITLDSVTIGANNTSPISLGDGAEATIKVKGSNTLTGDDGYAGIHVPKGASLNLGNGNDVGKGGLTVTGGDGAAGIGGNASGNCGDITITDALLVINGGSNAPGVGAGKDYAGGDKGTVAVDYTNATGASVKIMGVPSLAATLTQTEVGSHKVGNDTQTSGSYTFNDTVAEQFTLFSDPLPETRTLYFGRDASNNWSLYTNPALTTKYEEQTDEWSAADGVLTLKGFEFSTEAPVALMLTGNATITLQANTANSIASTIDDQNTNIDSYGIYSNTQDAAILINGSGSLTVNCGTPDTDCYAIGVTRGALTIDGATVAAINQNDNTNQHGIYAIQSLNIINGAKVTAESAGSKSNCSGVVTTALTVTGTGSELVAKGGAKAVFILTEPSNVTVVGSITGEPGETATSYVGSKWYTYAIGEDENAVIAKYLKFTPKEEGGGKTPGGGGGGSSTVPKDTTTEVKDTTIVTTGNQKVVENDDGSKSLPGGGTLTINDEVKLTAPNGTTIDTDGTVNIPDGKTATLDLTDVDATATVPGGSTIDTNGTVTVGGGKANITLPKGSEVTLPEGSTISGNKAVVGPGGATVKGSDGKTYTFDEGEVLVFDEDVPLGVYAQYQNPFVDVKENDWFWDAVRYVFENGVMKGTSANTFDPDVIVNRAMMAQIVWNLEGQPSAGNSTFDDVQPEDWFNTAVAWAAEPGIVLGIGGNKFAPLQEITREQMAAILYRYCEYKNITLPVLRTGSFADGASIEAYAAPAVNALYQAGILNGKDDGNFDPQGAATRAEIAQMMMNFIEATK